MEDKSFKTCPRCNTEWRDRDALMRDPGLDLIGYQPFFEDLTAGYFLFNHDVPWCKTTIAIAAGEFVDLYKGDVFEHRLTGAPECAGHCMHEADLEPCPNRCECAYVREIIQLLKNWQKADSPLKPPAEE